MNSEELFDYLKKVSAYIEYSFYKDSSEIMQAILNDGFENVMSILSLTEIKKGLYQCNTSWKVAPDQDINKNVNIDLTDEMIYITEVI
ncbi:MAG TPA: hypothetical protein PK033_07625 [Acetivibrio sp.]|jgi:hypothetical protein|nr:hypothetical protein [Clostridium sp.]HOQ38280.1 hypothetical protein [Acetivibrio sp.]HQA57731.1 hypothetical protein [Acetivibrio sp.]